MIRLLSRRAAAAVFASGLLLTGAAGCGGDRAAVEGTVTYDGVPVEDGAIAFVPEGGGPRVGARIAAGKYALDADHGPAPGKYKVEVTWNRAVGKRSADPDVQGGAARQVIPDKYNKATTLTADVKSGSNTLDYRLDR